MAPNDMDFENLLDKLWLDIGGNVLVDGQKLCSTSVASSLCPATLTERHEPRRMQSAAANHNDEDHCRVVPPDEWYHILYCNFAAGLHCCLWAGDISVLYPRDFLQCFHKRPRMQD